MDPVEMFLKYDYGETKDLLKLFLPIISGTIVLSITFSEKIIGFGSAAKSTRRIVILSWSFFIISLIFSGMGMCFIAAAAGKALYGSIPLFDYDVGLLAIAAWTFILLSGSSYVAGLIALIYAVIHGTAPIRGPS